MNSKKNKSNPFSNYSEEQIEYLVKSNDDLDLEEALMRSKAKEEKKLDFIEDKFQKRPYKRLIKSPTEILNRTLFFVFIGTFLYTFFLIYLNNKFWFFLYLISSFSCILYTPNRKAIKELIAAWPNIEDILRNRSLWK